MTLRLLTLIVLSISVTSACSMLSESFVSTPKILATDYCPEVTELLQEFDAAIAKGMEDENYDAFPDIEATVQGIALVAIRAEEEGLDLQSPESIWLNDLKHASRAFLTVLDGDAEYLTDEEERNVVANILNDFEAGAFACTPTKT
ncbi:hypothetical protein N9C74_00760 [Pontimonas sp.]|nr:hypothetical protein [Pontimonas sp.]